MNFCNQNAGRTTRTYPHHYPTLILIPQQPITKIAGSAGSKNALLYPKDRYSSVESKKPFLSPHSPQQDLRKEIELV